jgi:hypothetical protein
MRIFIFIYLLIHSSYVYSQHRPIHHSPYLQCMNPNGRYYTNLPLIDINAEVNIMSAIADVKLTQIYVNPYNQPIEVTYTFPGSTSAAVYGMTMRIGDRLVKAEIDEKKYGESQI